MRVAFTQAQWEELLADVQKQIEYLSRVKGGEYAHGEDRLDNFRRNAAEVGAPMATIWRIYAGKHWDSITTWVKDLQIGNTTRERSESIEGRLMDLIVYSILGIAIYREHEANEREQRGRAALDGTDQQPQGNLQRAASSNNEAAGTGNESVQAEAGRGAGSLPDRLS